MKNKIEAWVERCQHLMDKYYAKNFPSLCRQVLVINWGKRYAKIVRTETEDGKTKPFSKSVWAFVDMTNGNILKPASWKSPAKHARGNVEDDQEGMGWIGPHGPAYLR